MLGADNPEPNKAARKIWRYGSIVILIVALFSGWTIWSRWQENRGIERRAAEQQAAAQQRQDRATIEEMGGKELAIQNFYGSPSEVHKGETVQLCYGVANAKAVKLEPQDNPVWPSYGRCVDVKPTKTTTYTLTAEDGTGHSVTQTLEIKVK